MNGLCEYSESLSISPDPSGFSEPTRKLRDSSESLRKSFLFQAFFLIIVAFDIPVWLVSVLVGPLLSLHCRIRCHKQHLWVPMSDFGPYRDEQTLHSRILWACRCLPLSKSLTFAV